MRYLFPAMRYYRAIRAAHEAIFARRAYPGVARMLLVESAQVVVRYDPELGVSISIAATRSQKLWPVFQNA